MDYDLAGTTTEHRRRTESSQSQHQPPTQTRNLSNSSPLPQQEWERPSSQLSRERRQEQATDLEYLFSSYHLPQLPAVETQREDRAAFHQRRPPSFQTFLGRNQQGYFRNNSNALHIPDITEGSRRAVSQPNTPAAWEGHHHSLEIPDSYFGPLPRSPTYPPASRRRIFSASNVADATFTDDEEFRLFVEATAGLAPEQVDIAGDEEARPIEEQPSILSPVQQTPTTMLALAQLAQLPEGALPGERQRVLPPETPVSQRLSGAMAGVNLWIQPPDDPYDEDYVVRVDDELPDYAQSQAEAHAAQRVEAARRAQELQRRWQQSR